MKRPVALGRRALVRRRALLLGLSSLELLIIANRVMDTFVAKQLPLLLVHAMQAIASRLAIQKPTILLRGQPAMDFAKIRTLTKAIIVL